MVPKRLLAAAFAALVAGVTHSVATAAWADDGHLEVVAGTGAAGSAGDGGPATGALLDQPAGVAVAPDGTVYFSDAGSHTVRAVSTDGRISTVAGSGRPGQPGGHLPDGAVGTDVDLALPLSLAASADGTVYIADVGLFRVLALSGDRRLSTVAGTGTRGFAGDGGPATRASLGEPGGLAVAADGTVYIGDLESGRVRAVSPDGVIATVAGDGGERLTASGGVATATSVPQPNSLAVDAQGDLWIADGLVVHRLRGGKISTVTMPGGDRWETSDASTWPPPKPPVNNVAAVAAVGDDVYLLDQLERKILRLRAGSRLETASTPGHRIAGPMIGPIAAASGVVYLADGTGHRLYAIRAGSDAPGEGGEGSLPWWPFVVAGAVAVVAGAWLAFRRRTR